MSSNPREVTEADFRIPELREAKVSDYEFREDGALVRKDRWEQGLRCVVGLLEDFDDDDAGSVSRRKFEIEDVAFAVEQALTALRGLRVAAAEGRLASAAPIEWGNGCDKSAPTALRFLANNERPTGGEDRFNSAHLLQIADEIEAAANASKAPRS